MSYEQAGFDPTDPDTTVFDVHHATIHNVGFHIVEFGKLMDAAASEPMTLIDSPLLKTRHARHLTATLKLGENFDGKTAHLFDATIALRVPKGRPDNTQHFRRHVDGTQFEELKVHPFNFNNVRRLADTDGKFDASVAYYPAAQNMSIQNQSSYKDPTGRRQHRLIAPEKGKVDDGDQYVHFMRSVTAGLMVASSIERPYMRQLAPYDFVITPKGPLYFNPDSGEWVHQLEPQKVEIISPRIKEHTQAEVSSQKTKRIEDTTFEDLYGMEDVIEELGPLIAYYKNPEAAKRWDIKRPSGVFLKGPPGNAKTSLIYALANAIGATVHYINATDLYAKYFGESEAKTTAVFDKVRDATTPQILFFDEFEGLIATADDAAEGGKTYNVVAGTYKKESLRIVNENNHVLLAGASNKPHLIDEALIRDGRFDIKITIGNPLPAARKKIFGHHIISMENYGQVNPDETKGDTDIFRRFAPGLRDDDVLSELAMLTEDFSGASILNVLEAAKRRKFLQETEGQEYSPITKEDLIAEIMRKRRN